jgi:hypothetical protein
MLMRCRCPPLNSCGWRSQRRLVQAHLAQQFDGLGAQGGAAGLDPGLAAMDEQRLGHNLAAHSCADSGRRKGPEDGLHLAAQSVQLGPRSAGHIDAVYAHACPGWARPAPESSAPAWSCRSRTRPPAPASRRIQWRARDFRLGGRGTSFFSVRPAEVNPTNFNVAG